jgi:hypothetical protein
VYCQFFLPATNFFKYWILLAEARWILPQQ